MSDPEQEHSNLRIVLILALVVIGVAAIGVAVYNHEGASSLTLLQITVSAVLSAALVILYFRQTTILNAQRNLLTQEMNLEMRQEHTETLRDRVRTWHGNPDVADPGDILNNSSLNLPGVTGVSFTPAPTGSGSADPPEDEVFRVIPHQLDDDRYLDDLLENHADDLRETKEEIEELQNDFEAARNRFMETFDAGITQDKEDHTLKPTRRFSRWIFDLLIMTERDDSEDFDHLRDRAADDIERGNTAENPQGPDVWHLVSLGSTSSPIYAATWPENHQEDLSQYLDQVAEDVEEVVDDVLDRVEDRQPYDEIEAAARALDNGEAAIERLEKLLVEYDGRIVYPGDCKYLEEAQI